MELLGDATMVTVRINGVLLSVKAGKEYRANIGDDVHYAITPEMCHLFDTKSGERIEA